MKYEEVPKISNFTGAKSHNINVYSSIKKNKIFLLVN